MSESSSWFDQKRKLSERSRQSHARYRLVLWSDLSLRIPSWNLSSTNGRTALSPAVRRLAHQLTFHQSWRIRHSMQAAMQSAAFYLTGFLGYSVVAVRLLRWWLHRDGWRTDGGPPLVALWLQRSNLVWTDCVVVTVDRLAFVVGLLLLLLLFVAQGHHIARSLAAAHHHHASLVCRQRCLHTTRHDLRLPGQVDLDETLSENWYVNAFVRWEDHKVVRR